MIKRVTTLLLLATLAPATASVIARADANRCVSTIKTSGRDLTPELRVLKIVDMRNCASPIRVGDRDSSGVLWGTDNTNGVWESTDDGTSWYRVYVVTQYPEVEHVLPLASGALLVVATDASGNRHVVRVDSANRTGEDVFDLPSGSSLFGSQSWVEMRSQILMAEYGGDQLSEFDVWRSIDDGHTFATATSVTNRRGYGIRHFHSIQADPYSPGTLWITAGDVGYQPRIGFSADGGGTFTWITQGQPESRAVSLMFATDAVYWATDTPGGPGRVYRWDRASHMITQVDDSLNGPFYSSISFRGLMAAFSAVELPRNGYTGDQWVHVVSSSDGNTWNTAAAWMRAQDDATRLAAPTGITPTDAQGRFWISYYDLDGTPGRTVNVELQISPPNLRVTLGRSALLNSRYGKMFIFVACPSGAPGGWCIGSLSVAGGAAPWKASVVEPASYAVAAGHSSRIEIFLPASLAAKLGRSGAPRVTVAAATSDDQGRTATATATVPLFRTGLQ